MPVHKLRFCGCLCAVVSYFVLLEPAESLQWVYEENICRTPDLRVRNCIPVKKCIPMMQALETPNLTQDEIEKIQKYQCQVYGNSVKVCCPDGPILNRPCCRTENDEPLDVTNHTNFGLLPYNCGRQMSDDRITGGEKAVLFEFPWMALLSYDIGSGLDFRCAGTVINERYILTAAHCLTNLGTLKLRGIRVGELDIASSEDCEEDWDTKYCAPPVQDMPYEQVIPHPCYDTKTHANDIGLVRLAHSLNMSVDSVKPICLPTSKEVRNKNFTNENLIVTGWGITENRTKSMHLLKVTIPVTPEDTCRKTYERTLEITKRQICAGGKNRQDSCKGDSGGPLQNWLFFNEDVRYLQYGVVSFGPSNCGQTIPGVYTRVDYYLDWILDNLRP